MSMPKISDINPNITINREDAVNVIIASIAMEELALAHILNAEGEKLQYVLGTLEGADPGEITICDIMSVNDSIRKTLKDVIKTEMLLQLRLENVVEMADEESRITIKGQKIWRDGDNVAGTRPSSVTINLLRDGAVYKTIELDPMGDGLYSFTCLPVWRDAEHRYTYQIDEAVPPGYTSTISEFNIINTVEPGLITISGTKTWADNDDAAAVRPTDITVNLLQNGTIIDSLTLASPQAPDDTAAFNFPDVPQFDSEGTPFVYSVDEDEVTGYEKTINGFNITNTIA